MEISLPGLQCFVLEGLFFSRDGELCCQAEEGIIKVSDSLLPLKDKEIDLFLCHKPPKPLQPDRWGGGSCYWQPSGKCPAGHHNLSSVLLRVKERGILVKIQDQWAIRAEKGTVFLPFNMLEGHTGLFTGCNLDLPKEGDAQYSALEAVQVEMLSKVLETLKKAL